MEDRPLRKAPYAPSLDNQGGEVDVLNHPAIRLAAAQPFNPLGTEPLREDAVSICNHRLAQFIDTGWCDDVVHFESDGGLPHRVLDFRQYGRDGVAGVCPIEG